MLTIVPNDNSYTTVQDHLQERMNAAEIPFKVQARVMVVTDELWSNIVRYSGATEASVEIGVERDMVMLRFIDDGVAFDPTTAEGPDTSIPAEDRPIGGLGILMVQQMSSLLLYEREGDENVLTVGFRIEE